MGPFIKMIIELLIKYFLDKLNRGADQVTLADVRKEIVSKRFRDWQAKQ